jgi:hypothetical protein
VKPLLPVREHCRTIGEVILPDGDRRAWRWYDPEVLRAVLPTLLAGQLDELFGLGQAIVIPASRRVDLAVDGAGRSRHRYPAADGAGTLKRRCCD